MIHKKLCLTAKDNNKDTCFMNETNFKTECLSSLNKTQA